MIGRWPKSNGLPNTYANGKSSQNDLDYVCICGDVNLNITEKPKNNDFI